MHTATSTATVPGMTPRTCQPCLGPARTLITPCIPLRTGPTHSAPCLLITLRYPTHAGPTPTGSQCHTRPLHGSPSHRRYYSLFTLFMLVTFECTVVQQRLRNLTELRSLQTAKQHIQVYR
jgi:hypothetical protein